jgi:hypothetical protein
MSTLSSPAAAPAAATPVKVCVLCGELFTEFGNNPWPLATLDDGQCCNMCNSTLVIPARLLRLDARLGKA